MRMTPIYFLEAPIYLRIYNIFIRSEARKKMGVVKFKEPFRPVLLNLSVDLIEQLDSRAADLSWTRSDLVRHFLSWGLAAKDTPVELTPGPAVTGFRN